jgi:hypothetical protein
MAASATRREPPRITFTHDFHELVRGDLRPGAVLTLRYDPLRIVRPEDDYVFGDPGRPVVAHLLFRSGEPPLDRTLQSRLGMLSTPDIDRTGNGSMLTAQVPIPDDADRLEIWFTYASRRGLEYDNDQGRNFWFGFTEAEFRLIDTDVVARDGGAEFRVRVAAAKDVDKVTVRLRPVTAAAFEKIELDLARTDEVDGDWPVWSLAGVQLPAGAHVLFKLYYWRAGVRYKDDNEGRYFPSPPPPVEIVPPPPPELAEAAKAWS